MALALIIACSPLAVPAFAADPETVGAAVSHPGEVDLRALLRELGVKLHKQFVWDPRIPQTIELGNLDRREMTYADLLAVLDLNRMTVVPREGMAKVIVIDDVRQAAMPVVPPGLIKTLDDEWITTVLVVRSVSAMQLVPTLRPFVATQGQLVALPDRNALIITDRSSHVRRLIEIIKALEEAPKTLDSGPAKSP